MPADLPSLASLLDENDGLAPLRKRFLLPEELIYFDGNSLGPLPDTVPGALESAVTGQWAEGLARSYPDWMALPGRVADRISRLVGAAPGQVSVGDSTSVQIFNGLTAAARLRPGRRILVTDPDHFPTDRYLADSVARLLGLRVREVRPDKLGALLDASGDEVAVVAYPAVDYRTGRLWDVAGVTAAVHLAGAVTLWDVCHAVGAVPLEFDAHEVDFAVGCGYKYLSGGPGAPAFLYIREPHIDAFDQPMTGWLGHATPFAPGGPYVPASGIGRATIGTPPVLSMVALDAALEVFEGVALEEIRLKSLSLSAFFFECVDELLAGQGFETVTPRDAALRGSHVSLRHPAADPLVRALIERGVIGDMRPPDLLRFGFNALFVSHTDVYTAVLRLHGLISSGDYLDPRFARQSPFG